MTVGFVSNVTSDDCFQLQQMLEDELTESQNLSDALRAERQVYLSLNQAGNLPPR